jgi:hypothetical protein
MHSLSKDNIMVLGIVDSYDSIHTRLINIHNPNTCKTHSEIWPEHKHKRFRYYEDRLNIMSEWVPSEFEISSIKNSLQKLGYVVNNMVIRNLKLL